MTVSPDGSRLAFETVSQGQRRIFLRRLDSDETVELQGSLGATGHFWSPDSRHLAFWADGRLKKIPITARLARFDRKPEAEYSPTGHLVYAREGALCAQRFDERTARLMGEPVLVADDVNYFLNTAQAAFSVSQTGVLTYRAGTCPSRLTWFGRDGKDIGQLGQLLMGMSRFRISPDGARVAMGISDKHGTEAYATVRPQLLAAGSHLSSCETLTPLGGR